MKLALYKPVSIFVLLLSLSGFIFAQSDREKGIELYRKGDYEGAIKILKNFSKNNSSDAQAWYFLGASYIKKNAYKDAINAFNKTIEINPKNSPARTGLAFAYLIKGKLDDARREAQKALELTPGDEQANYILGIIYFRDGIYNLAYERAKKSIELNSKFANAYLLKSQTLVSSFAQQSGTVLKSENSRSELLKEATSDLETYLNLSPNNEETKFYGEYLESLKFFAQYYQNKSANSLDSTNGQGNNTTPLKILSKPRPSYTDRARDALVSGTIRVLAGFSADGKVNHVLVIKSLGYGLDEEAVKAARAIKFEPETKDGKPVSVVKTLEYSFSVGATMSR